MGAHQSVFLYICKRYAFNLDNENFCDLNYCFMTGIAISLYLFIIDTLILKPLLFILVTP